MKILQIFPGKVWGGAEQYILDLGKALQALGHEVCYVCLDALPVTARLTKEGIRFTPLRPLGGLCAGALLTRRLLPLVAGADVVHVHDARFVGPAVAAAERAGSGAKVVFTRHIARSSRTLPWRRGSFRKLHAAIFVSELAQRLWLGANPWMAADRCCVVHNSIPDEVPLQTADCSLRRRFGIDDEAVLLLFTGRVRRSKGCATILEALARVGRARNWAMVFVGAGKPLNYPQTLLKRARALGIDDRIHFCGFSSEVRRLVPQADIGLQPSIVREACPLSPMEFMQVGLPVITTDNGGQTEYVADGRTGLLIPPADAAALAAAIERLLDDPSARRSIGAAAAADFAARWSYAAFLQKIVAVYSR